MAETILSLNAFTTSTNTDLMADYRVRQDGIIRLGVETVEVSNVRITLDGTTYTTLIDTAADIWQFLEIPVTQGDLFNIQTVDIEIISLRIILIDK